MIIYLYLYFIKYKMKDNNDKNVCYIKRLSNEIIQEITKYLDMKSYRALKCTCKLYNKLLYDEILEKLLSRQVLHYEKLYNCITTNDYPVAVDISIMGSGKTYTLCCLAKKLNIILVIFCPKSVIPTWFKVIKYFNIDKYYIFTYAKLRIENDFLTKEHIIKDKWKEIVKKGTLLVFDESQNLKNKTAQYRSAVSLVDVIYKQDKRKSYVMLLSGTIADKEYQIARYCRLMGIMKKDKLSHQNLQTKTYTLDGIEDIINYCIKDDLYQRSLLRINKYTKHKIVHDLFLKYIKPKYFYAMDPPVINNILDVKNGFYIMSPEKELKLKESISALKRCILYNNDNNDNNVLLNNNVDWGIISKYMREIEISKVEIMIRLVLNKLKENNTKVICMLSYNESIDQLKLATIQYNPLIITGKCSNKSREKNIDLFNNNNMYRLLICNLKISSLGLSLHDIRGNYPRTLYIMPNYEIMNLHQATRRIYREGNKSDATVRFIYGVNQTIECFILNSLSRKSLVMKSLSSDNLSSIKYPVDYDSYYEENIDNTN